MKKLENYVSYKKSHESKHSFSTFYISLPKFKALGSIIKKKSKTESVPLIDNTGGRERALSYLIIDMRTIGMEDNWHAENWHGGQLALTFLIVSLTFLFNYFNVLTNNKFHFQIITNVGE